MNTTDLSRRDILLRSGFLAAGSLLPSAAPAFGAGQPIGYLDPTPGTADPIAIGKSIATVETMYGKMGGYLDRGVLVFKGVPYGASTAGAGRFMPPRPPASWSGLRSSRHFGPESPQPYRAIWENDEEGFLFQWDYGRQSEDCLRLNIWTPSTEGAKRPVLVYLHGGGYSVGSSSELKMFDGVNLAKRGDVVLVTINHRLNVVGYFDLSEYGDEFAESGNVGTLDTVAALRWVAGNIEQFGGDSGNVLIFGQSGGGGKVCTLMVTPAARGLFHKAVVESGATLRIGTQDRSRELAERTVKRLGISPAEIRKLQEIPYAQLEAAASAVISEARPPGPIDFRHLDRYLGYVPIVDGKVVTHQPFDPAAPESAAQIPLLIGNTLNEMTNGINHPDAFTMTPEQLRAKADQSFPGHGPEVIASYRELYPNANPFQLWSVINASPMRGSSLKLAEIKAKQPAPVYVYQFAWQTPVLDARPMAFHCAELPFVFDNSDRCEHMTGGGEAARVLAGRVSQAWINFARSGNPNHSGIPHWPPFVADTRTTMVFDNHCEAKANLDSKQLELVKKLSV